MEGCFCSLVAGFSWRNGFALPVVVAEGVLPYKVQLGGCEEPNGPRAVAAPAQTPSVQRTCVRMAGVCVVLWQLIQDLFCRAKKPVLKSTKRLKYFRKKNIRSSSPFL